MKSKNSMNNKWNLYKRWRIAKHIESGTPMPRSLTNAMDKSPELRAYSDAMQRVDRGLHTTGDPVASPLRADRIRLALERDGLGDSQTQPANRPSPAPPSETYAWSAPFRLASPLGLAAAVALLSTLSILAIRPWSSPSNQIVVTGEFTTLVSLFQPIDNRRVVAWMDESLSDEAQALIDDAQNIANSVLWGIQGAGLIGSDPEESSGNVGNQPG